ncbi:cysteine proteinase, partial [Mycena rosella]
PTATEDDNELMDELLSQLDSRDETVKQESANVLNDMQLNQQADQIEAGSKQDPKSRFRARQARKAASLAQNYVDDPAAEARLQKEAKDEERDINRVCDELNLQIHEINPDGHCLFSAIADQLQLLSIIPAPQASYVNTRVAASTYIYTHPDDFLPFLPSAAGEDGAGALDAGLMSPQEFEQYCASIRDTAVWGGEPEILALSRAYNVPIHVIQGGQPPVVVHNPTDSSTDAQVTDERVVRISYHRRMYGLGEHYNSLRPKTTRSQISHALHSVLP